MALPPPSAEEKSPGKDLAGQVEKIGTAAFAQGAFSDLYRGIWTDPSGAQRRVAIKVLRAINMENEEKEVMKRRLNRESRIWDTLHHQNVLQFFGVAYDLDPNPALISPMCEGGTVMKFIRRNPTADKSQLIGQVAQGLHYLHSKEVVHGDLKTNNVVVNDDGEALICDFGRSKFLEVPGYTSVLHGSARYMAPELFGLEGSDSNEAADSHALTKESDVYSFAMVAVEIVTEKQPFHETKNDLAVINKKRHGFPNNQERSPQYVHIWEIIDRCARIYPQERPVIMEVANVLP